MNDQFGKLFSRPGMYLACYDKTFDAGSIFINFLHAVFDSPHNGYPEQVDFISADQHFSIAAYGDFVKLPEPMISNLIKQFEVENYQKVFSEIVSPDFGYLRPIIWFSEFCLVDVCNESNLYRQAFLRGQAISDVVQSKLNGFLFSLAFNFTLPNEIFESKLLSFSRLQDAINAWEQADKRRVVMHPEQQLAPKLNCEWLRHSQYHYHLRITPKVTED